MPVNDYICLNGEFLHGNEPRLFTSNRAIRFNDAVVENIHASATVPQFLDLHLARLIESMNELSMPVPLHFNSSNFRMLIKDLLNKNRIFSGAHIMITVFRNTGDHLIPLRHDISYIMESRPLEVRHYELNEKGLTIGISKDFTRYSGGVPRIHRAHLSLFMLAAIEGKKKGFDAVILLNEEGRLTETADSNIFLVSGNSLFTPAPEQGCINGIMRRVILNCAAKVGFRTNDQSSLTPAALFDAEEVFLTNAVNGISWAGAFQQKRYFNKNARLFNSMLNDLAFQ